MKRASTVVFVDFISFVISFIILIFIRFESADYLSAISLHMGPFILLYLSWVLIFYIFGLYDLLSIKPTIPYIKRWIMALLCSFGLGILLFYLVPIFGISPKINLVIQTIGFGIFSFMFRRIIYRLFSELITEPTIFIGESPSIIELRVAIESNPQLGLKIIGSFKNINDINLDLNKLKNLVIILDKDIKTQDQNILNFYKKDIKVIDTAKAYEKYLYKIPVEYIDLSFIIENVETKKERFYQAVTFIIDKFFALLILIVTSPFLIVAMIATYLNDKGPILYTQNRVGLNGKIFKLYKLRSMKTDSEKSGPKWSTGSNDDRVTEVGKITRKLHIDEIPQVINILKGDLSLVGPRPERPEFVELLNKEIPYYSFRHIIRPGFTGWAQIKYRYANTIDSSKEKFEFDLYYIKNRNIFIDFGVIIRTIQIIFTH
jgi:exopolysaccharide biosynthesis polyprenyl glycosylphosphotransferase